MTLALVIEWLIKAIVLVLILLGGFAYLTLYERKALARIQMRVGPNRAGPWGILQPIADAVKLIFKEELMPARADKLLFFLAPVVTLVPALVITAVVPWGPTLHVFGRDITLYIADINVGVLYIMSVASIAVYGIVLAGWSSNNKYAMMGGLRSTAQMISYEIALGLSFVGVILLAGSAQMTEIVAAQKTLWFAVLQPVGTAIFLIATLAEVNRAPFDMPEAEQETDRWLPFRIFRHEIRPVVYGRIRQNDRHQLHRGHAVLRRLPGVLVPFEYDLKRGPDTLAGPDLHFLENLHPALRDDLGAGHFPAHPLRPPDGFRLESDAAAFAGADLHFCHLYPAGRSIQEQSAPGGYPGGFHPGRRAGGCAGVPHLEEKRICPCLSL